MKKFTHEHEWITLNGNVGTVGISDYAQKQLGDVVYVTLTKKIGTAVKKGEEVAEVESVKSVSQIYSPASGKIIEFNEIFKDEANSGVLNQDPYGKGWIFKIEASDLGEVESLLDEKKYEEYIKNL